MASLLLGSLSGVLRGAFQGAAIEGVVEHVEAQFGDAIEARAARRGRGAPARWATRWWQEAVTRVR